MRNLAKRVADSTDAVPPVAGRALSNILRQLINFRAGAEVLSVRAARGRWRHGLGYRRRTFWDNPHYQIAPSSRQSNSDDGLLAAHFSYMLPQATLLGGSLMPVVTPSATRGKPAPSVRPAAVVAPVESPILTPPVAPPRTRLRQIATESARGSSALGALQEVLLKRFQSTVADLVEQLSEAGVRHALEQNTGFESLEVALGDLSMHAAVESASERVERVRDLHRAQADLLVRAGGAASATDAGELLGGVTRQAVEKRRERGTLLAVNIQREFWYPLFQFEQSAILEGLPDVLKAFTVRNEWTQLSVLLSSQDALDGRSIIDALRAGEVKAAAAVAASFGNTGS